MLMPLDMSIFDRYDREIIRILSKYPEGIRNAQLNREAKIDGQSINVKTFNLHLKQLVKVQAVDRRTHGRANVVYKLRLSEDYVEKRRVLTELTESVCKELARIYDSRQNTSQKKAEDSLKDLFTVLMKFVRRMVVGTIFNSRDVVALNLDINEILESLRESLLEAYSFTQGNAEKRAFFNPMLEKIEKLPI
jgi:DNA-binding HxlR family transcriptional regulator